MLNKFVFYMYNESTEVPNAQLCSVPPKERMHTFPSGLWCPFVQLSTVSLELSQAVSYCSELDDASYTLV